ncbi:hypothetical protein PF003_g1677 [Phytophthora fragariae]|nr:hypothetical protein PF003_g1677 [Phytophthora fragariae]
MALIVHYPKAGHRPRSGSRRAACAKSWTSRVLTKDRTIQLYAGKLHSEELHADE